MARTKAILGYGFQLRKGTGSPPTYAAIAELRSLSEFGVERDIEEVTHTDSPNRYLEFIKKLKDGSRISFMGNATEDNFSEMVADVEDDTEDPIPYELFMPGDLSTWRFSAHPLVAKFNELTPNAGIQFRGELKITGPLEEV